MNFITRSLRLACVVTGMGFVSTSGAQIQNAPAAAGSYRISGKVVDAHTGAALARCTVQIANVKGASQPRTVRSADDGKFAFDGLPLGKYSLTAERRGYLAQSFEQHGIFSTAIAVAPGMVSENLIFKLVAEAVLTGTVTDEAGEPVRLAAVRLFEDQDAEGIRTTREKETVYTDDRGIYELASLRPGAYFLVVTARPWYTQQLQPGGGAGSHNRQFYVAYPTTFYAGVTDQDEATPIPVKGGERLVADVTLTPRPALRLRLNLPAGDANEHFGITLSQTLFGQVELQPTADSYTPDGAVEIDGVLPGHYEVTVNRFAAAIAGTALMKAETKHFDADVASGATTLSEDTATGEVAVTGSVASAAGKLPAGAVLVLRTPHHQSQNFGQVDDAGNFSVAVVPGTYEVVGGMAGIYIESIKATGGSLVGRMLTVKAGDSPKLEVVVSSGHGTIEGTVLKGDKPVSAVMVLLAPEDPKNNAILFQRDQSDSDGTFLLPYIIPGRYHLLALEDAWEMEWANADVLAAFLAKSVPIEIRAGEHLKESVQVQAAKRRGA